MSGITYQQTKADMIDSLKDYKSYRKSNVVKPVTTNKVAPYTEEEYKEYNQLKLLIQLSQ